MSRDRPQISRGPTKLLGYPVDELELLHVDDEDVWEGGEARLSEAEGKGRSVDRKEIPANREVPSHLMAVIVLSHWGQAYSSSSSPSAFSKQSASSTGL